MLDNLCLARRSNYTFRCYSYSCQKSHRICTSGKSIRDEIPAISCNLLPRKRQSTQGRFTPQTCLTVMHARSSTWLPSRDSAFFRCQRWMKSMPMIFTKLWITGCLISGWWETSDEDCLRSSSFFSSSQIKHAPLIQNDESYMMLPNGLQYTRQWMNRIIGEEMVQTMFEFARKFNALRLTQEEHALIFPVVICVKGKCSCRRRR